MNSYDDVGVIGVVGDRPFQSLTWIEGLSLPTPLTGMTGGDLIEARGPNLLSNCNFLFKNIKYL